VDEHGPVIELELLLLPLVAIGVLPEQAKVLGIASELVVTGSLLNVMKGAACIQYTDCSNTLKSRSTSGCTLSMCAPNSLNP
jgi:hypothetical protein